MQLDRDPDMLDLEKALSSIGKEQDAETDNSEVHRDSFNSNTTTLHNFSTTNDASSLEVEAVIKPALHHELDLRQDVKHLEASPISDGLPDVKPLAWSRYAVIGVYRRLFSLVFLGNLAAFIWIMVEDRSLLTIINAAAANLLALGLARQPVVVNFLFKAFGLVPRSVPLRLRRLCAKIYCYGGVHSGAGIASLFWYVGFIVVLTQDYIVERQATNHSSRSFAISPALMALSYIILILLLAIIIAAYPKIRFMLHDYFELTHRFCGWTVVALFWPLLILASIVSARSQQKPLGHIIIRFPTFWMLILTTLAILHPWLLLLRIKFTAEEISTHAIRLHFHHTTINFGQVIQLAKHPLRDWHSFATFPNIPSQPGTNGSTSKSAGFSCLISKAGDWTGNIIASPPSHLWKRGIPIYGFGHAMRLFSRIVVVTTGSGIGPCLSFLSEPNRPAMRVVWQTRAPVRTYGRGIMNAVYQLDPEPEVLDTSVTGRVDMLLLVMRLYREFEAEAVCVISNPLATRKLVFECESRGVPAFGPIFDS